MGFMDKDLMTGQLDSFAQIFTLGRTLQWLIAVLILLIGIVLSRLAKRGARRICERYFSPQQALLAGRTLSLLILVTTFAAALTQAGIDLSVALGAAGIVTVAVGFAAQTSASNLISGLFLMGERPFVIGDTIQVGDTLGEVISIDLLSAKLRTVDHRLVRIPNETLLKSEIVNLSYFEQRRLDLPLGLAYGSDLEKAEAVLLRAAAELPLCLAEPVPDLAFLGFGESSLDLRFSVWVKNADYLEAKSQLLTRIQRAFDQEGISFPFPHRALVATTPLRVQVEADPGRIEEKTP